MERGWKMKMKKESERRRKRKRRRKMMVEKEMCEEGIWKC